MPLAGVNHHVRRLVDNHNPVVFEENIERQVLRNGPVVSQNRNPRGNPIPLLRRIGGLYNPSIDRDAALIDELLNE